MRKVFTLSIFFILTPLILTLSFGFLFYIEEQQGNILFGQRPSVAYAALPSSNSATVLNAVTKDARVEAVDTFLKRYKSALAPFSKYIVATADKYNLDYRLVPAIAMQESTLCNNLPKKLKGTYNCWGFGIYGKKVTKFDNFKQAIDIVTKTLAKEYKNNGLNSPEEIMSKYTPSNSGVWAQNVSLLMERLSI